ncbi:hypothetical protein HPO96_00020 [Kribbella sandramycini]|uniref:Uncharacterized protein n=1 Tax=Kribbella sandramycini TaxID=60450 RepID=A0A7Y4KV72_9ACTN|nr:hypothetical protein [Kribbella sandramycini]MBB6568797.1 hypothetical protein [Kribbella sandramycini]NOL38622.1 hypothetical protein [Kribbella sandramycini]
MTGKKDKGAGDANPWVSKPGPDEDSTAAPKSALPPSPWNLEVPPAPGTPSPWSGDAADDPAGGPAAGSGPATETPSAWGEKVGPPSLRRPPPAKQKPRIPPLLLPIGAGVLVIVLVTVALVLLSGGGDKGADPLPSASTTPSASVPSSTYTPPAGAIPVAFGVSVVPVPGWTLLETETRGKELVTYAPNGKPRGFFWVRQKENVGAQAYLLAIVEGETENEVAQLGNTRNLPCPKDVLVECVAISYTSIAKDETGADVNVQGYVEVYVRKDKVATALDFRTRTDFAPKAEADAALMKQSVLDSL